MQKKLSSIIKIFLIMGFISHIPFAAADNSSVQPLDQIVAIVNNQVITQSQLQKQIDFIKAQLQGSNIPMPDDATLRKQVLNQLVDQKMLTILAQRNNLQVTDAQLNQALNDIATRNHGTVAQLQATVVKQGINYDDFLQQIRDQILMQEVEARALGPQLAVTNAEVQAYMKKNPASNDMYHLQDILIPLDSSPSAAELNTAQQKGKVILIQWQNNAMDQFARRTDIQMNDLGWRATKDLPDVFLKTVIAMKTGQIVGPVRAPNGFHLLKLVEMKTTGPALTPIQARQILMQQKLQTKLKPWLEQLRKSAYVKIM